MILTVDPGTKVIGWALWRGDRLADCGMAVGDNWIKTVRAMPYIVPSRLVIEDQQIYRTSKIDANTLLSVARVVGAVTILYNVREVELVKPREWKGQVPKAICNRRTVSRLSDEEKKVLMRHNFRASLMHNLYDAIGIGLWILKR